MHHSNPLRRSESYAGKPPRNIIAPYQKSGDNNNGHSNNGSAPGSVSNEAADHRNFKFVDLEEIKSIKFDKYCGPTPESNWVIPGILLVGAYPASQDDSETYDLLTSVLKQGVTKFVCLQQEYRDQGVTEEMWRSGHALRPYFRDVQMLVRNKAMFPDLQGYNIVDEDDLTFVHFPIRDCGVTDDGRVLELARSLVQAISEGEVIYLHCWGGHGRTGTLVCIMLHLMYGLDAVEAMSRCQHVHDLRKCPVVVGSPQTQTQRDQVVRVIHRLQTQTQFHRRTLSNLNIYSELIGAEQKSPRSPMSATYNSSAQQHGNSNSNSNSIFHDHSKDQQQQSHATAMMSIFHQSALNTVTSDSLDSQIDGFSRASSQEQGQGQRSHGDSSASAMTTDSSVPSSSQAMANGSAATVAALGLKLPLQSQSQSQQDAASPMATNSASSSPTTPPLSSPRSPASAAATPGTGAGTGQRSLPASPFTPQSLVPVCITGAAFGQATTSPSSLLAIAGDYFIGDDNMAAPRTDACTMDVEGEVDTSDGNSGDRIISAEEIAAEMGTGSVIDLGGISARPPESAAPTSATLAGGAAAGLRNFRSHWVPSLPTVRGSTNTSRQSSRQSSRHGSPAPFSAPITGSGGRLPVDTAAASPGNQTPNPRSRILPDQNTRKEYQNSQQPHDMKRRSSIEPNSPKT